MASLLLGACPVACGGDEGGSSGNDVDTSGSGGDTSGSGGAAPASGGQTSAGVGGTGGGSGGSSASSGGAGAQVVLHECPATPAPSCPEKVWTGSFDPAEHSLSELSGVTKLDGDLAISDEVVDLVQLIDLSELDTLECLEEITGDVTIGEYHTRETLGTLWGLRNLRIVGGSVDIIARVPIDCGLARLESLGNEPYQGGALDLESVQGELDLSKLVEGMFVRIQETQLTRVTLPSNRALAVGQYWFSENPELAAIDGFADVTLTRAGSSSGGNVADVQLDENPLLSQCRVDELAALFLAAGFSESEIVADGNGPCP